MFHVNENYRVREGQLKTDELDGHNGLFLIPSGSDIFQCIVSDGAGWEHVSVCIRTKNRKIYALPTWNQMCFIKEQFWDDEDIVVQYHPKKSEYVNNHPFVLHLWRPTNQKLPYPDSLLIGIR